mgnify:CR=1 FL=1
MVYLLISICISSFLFVIFKLFDVLKINTFQAIVVNYFTAAVLGFFLSNNLVSFQKIPNQPWFFGAFLLGIMFILVFNVMALTSQKNGLSVASVSSKMSVVIAIIFGVWYYEESIGLVKLIGILLALVAVYLTSIKEKNEIVKKNKDFLYSEALYCNEFMDEIFCFDFNKYNWYYYPPNLQITNNYISSTSGITHVYFRQVLNGIQISGTESDIHILPNGTILTENNKFIKGISGKLKGATVPSLSSLQAVELTAQQLNYSISESLSFISQCLTVLNCLEK